LDALINNDFFLFKDVSDYNIVCHKIMNENEERIVSISPPFKGEKKRIVKSKERKQFSLYRKANA